MVCGSVQACEPVIPFIQVVGGPGMLTRSLIVLVAAVALKSVAFALWQTQLRFGHAVLFMIAGNVLTTVIGVVAGVMMASGLLLFVGTGVAWVAGIVPARRLIGAFPKSRLRFLNAEGLAGLMAAALAVSCLLFGTIQMGFFAESPWLHWSGWSRRSSW
jgi:hypothetical protein